jgi:hypothetical protein
MAAKRFLVLLILLGLCCLPVGCSKSPSGSGGDMQIKMPEDGPKTLKQRKLVDPSADEGQVKPAPPDAK